MTPRRARKSDPHPPGGSDMHSVEAFDRVIALAEKSPGSKGKRDKEALEIVKAYREGRFGKSVRARHLESFRHRLTS